MGRHSRTAPLATRNPYTRPKTAGYLESLPSHEPQRLRQDAFQDRFETGRTPVVSLGADHSALDPGSPVAQADRASLARTLSKTSVPLEHLNGVQFMHVMPDMMSETTMAQYFPQRRGMEVPRMNGPDVHTRAQQARSVVHELGHHVENTANARMSSMGRAEAMAENYADTHLPPVPVSHAGVTTNYRPPSGYDAHAKLKTDVWQQSWDPTGEQNLARYEKTRARGTLPGEY